MPLLFSLGIHDALAKVRGEMEDDEYLFAYLDDVYAIAPPERVRDIYNLLAENLFEHAGIRLHEGKTRVWNRAQECPEGLQDLGPEVWSPDGIKVLGTPVGDATFTQKLLDERLAEQQKLWTAIPTVTDLQCSWQLLAQCATAQANHILRTVPPAMCAGYAEAHDTGIWAVVDSLLGGCPGEEEDVAQARLRATLPMRLGGLGLR
eukprot:7023383-Karenia_brevis.AAC.1